MQIQEIIKAIEEFAPPAYQESYDNAGLLIGNAKQEASGVIVNLDCTEAVVDEALQKGANLIVVHHPLIFRGLKRITGKNFIERIVIKAIKNDIAIYAAHTNLDSVQGGVNSAICDKIGLINRAVLSPVKGALSKLVVFVPQAQADNVRKAIFEAGAGQIGDYDCCSFNLNGQGTFRGSDNTNPFVGEKNKLHFEDEVRIETILPNYMTSKVVSAMIEAHPYEEVAYDLYPLNNEHNRVGLGMVGELENPVDEIAFLEMLKEKFEAKIIRHSQLAGKQIKKVAVCGGSGSSLLDKAKASGADVFVSGDFKYHQFFDANNRIVIADVGHFETEQFTKEIFYRLLIKKFPNFAVFQSEVNTNPINFI